MTPRLTSHQSINMDYPESRSSYRRNLAGFWILGLTNNYAYVIMLSAANDILADQDPPSNSTTNFTTIAPTAEPLVPHCNTIGTGAVLLADILPTLIIKLTAPFYAHLIPYSARVCLIVVFGAASFPIVSASNTVWLSLLGVVCASIGAGLGEITFLSLSSHFDKNVVSTWSSGTGAAGLFGALSYAGLTAVGVSPRVTLLIMLISPLSMFLTYFLLLVKPPSVKRPTAVAAQPEDGTFLDIEDEIHASEEFTGLLDSELRTSEITFMGRLSLIVPLLRYMVPLGLVYLAEYFINQALFELITFEGIWLPWDQQYRWYQVIYQMGVFVSRSSVNICPIKYIWIMPILQFGNVAFLLCQILYQFVPSIWIIFFVILFEGLLGGAAYVNTFFRISKEVAKEHLEYSMGVTSVADSAGITIAGIIAVPVHNLFCTL